MLAALPVLAGVRPVTAASLALEELTQPRGLFVWNAALDVDATSTEALRSVAATLWRARAEGVFVSAESLVVECLAERDLAGTLKAMLALMRRDAARDDGGRGVQLDDGAAQLWCRLAGRDWPAALALLEGVPAGDAARRFWFVAASESKLPPNRLPAFMDAMAGGLADKRWEWALYPALWNAVKGGDVRKCRKLCQKCRNRGLRQVAERLLLDLEKNPPFKGSGPESAQAPVKNQKLRRLLALDTSPGQAGKFPFPLLREVAGLDPEAALELAEGLAEDKAVEGTWLAWMLFMQAAGGDAAKAQTVAVETGNQLLRAGHAGAVYFARRPDLSLGAAMEELRRMESPEQQRQAMQGFLLGAPAQGFIKGEQGNPFMALAAEVKLPADYWQPGLCLAAASGGGVAAVRTAQILKWETASSRGMLEESILRAWALSDFGGFENYLKTITHPDELISLGRARDFARALLQKPEDAEPQ